MKELVQVAVGGTRAYVSELSDRDDVDPQYLLGCLDCLPVVEELGQLNAEDSFQYYTDIVNIGMRLVEGIDPDTAYGRGKLSFVRMFLHLMDLGV